MGIEDGDKDSKEDDSDHRRGNAYYGFQLVTFFFERVLCFAHSSSLSKGSLRAIIFVMQAAPLPERFEQFMARALHDTSVGYYSQRVRTVGREGDFSTASTLLPGLGRAVASWILEKAGGPGMGKPVHVIEVGGGTGALMQGVLKSLGWWGRRKFRFHSVESSVPLRKEQRERLKAYGVEWHETMVAALKHSGGCALIYSNELVDAFPCMVMGFQEGVWQELCLEWEGKEAVEVWRKAGETMDWDAAVLEDIEEICPRPRSGQRLEIPRCYRLWMEQWLPHWKKGNMLTIDYGDKSGGLLKRHPYGSLRAYFRHLRLEGAEIYRRVGSQDITYDVNFSLLEAWGRKSGLRVVSCQSQTQFLAAYGQEVIQDSKAYEAQNCFLILDQERRFGSGAGNL